MTVARPRLTFKEYLMYDDDTDKRYELVQGELVELPPETEEKNWIALNLRSGTDPSHQPSFG